MKLKSKCFTMEEKKMKSASKLLSYVLRHSPESIGLELDEQGWADVAQLLYLLNAKGDTITMSLLEEIVVTNDKKRFAFNEDKTRIRASQGHSIAIELGLTASEPPEYLYHGTVALYLNAIRQEGLKKMSRQHVHLSTDKETAERVGSRRGKAVILVVRSGKMYRSGISFYKSENGVWLTEVVTPEFIEF